MRTATVIAIILFTLNAEAVMQRQEVDLSKIAAIESNWDSCRIGRAGEVGLFQISKECLVDFNIHHKTDLVYPESLFDAITNLRVAAWYFNERIPGMIRKFKRPITIENVIIAYNAGIKYVRDNIRPPQTTIKYIKKYMKIESNMPRLNAYKVEPFEFLMQAAKKDDLRKQSAEDYHTVKRQDIHF